MCVDFVLCTQIAAYTYFVSQVCFIRTVKSVGPQGVQNGRVM